MRFTAGALAAAILTLAPLQAFAASSKFCKGGAYTTLGQSALDGDFDGTVAAPSGQFVLQGQYTQFFVDPATFAVYNYSWLGKANKGDMVDGTFTTVYTSKVPDHRGSTLDSDISLELKDETFKLSRSGPDGLTMTLTGKDCAQGGIFQMEVARTDNARTRIVHTLAPGVFQYDNPTFRANLGKFLGSGCTSATTGPAGAFCVQVRPRVNMGSDAHPRLIFRDSAQVSTRIAQAGCGPDFTNALGLAETKDYCGGMSIWDVASGGRMGFVTGEDATEVANPPTTCVTTCQPEEEGAGTLANLGFTTPVPAGARLTPRVSVDGLGAALTAPFVG